MRIRRSPRLETQVVNKSEDGSRLLDSSGIINKESKKGLFQLNVDKIPQGLRDYYLCPPFSILDTKQGDWQNRRRLWLSIGIVGELGRGMNLLGFSYASAKAAGKAGDLTKEEWDDLVKKNKDNNFGVSIKGPLGDDADLYRKNKEKGFGQCLNTRIGEKYGRKPITGTSIFDPVLCELMYRWFSPLGGMVLDPFAGGSCRGIVASVLGRKYTGIELRKEQVQANEIQFEDIINRFSSEQLLNPLWICDDTRNIDNHIPEREQFDFLFTCPPYGDLEVYGDNPNDLSTMSHEDFLINYKKIISLSVPKLKDNRFACFVVSDFRDKKTGFYRNFVGNTIAFFQDAGIKLYNEMILVNVIGSLPIRVGKQFDSSRKVGKMHQNVLVFYKGKDFNDIPKLFRQQEKK